MAPKQKFFDLYQYFTNIAPQMSQYTRVMVIRISKTLTSCRVNCRALSKVRRFPKPYRHRRDGEPCEWITNSHGFSHVASDGALTRFSPPASQGETLDQVTLDQNEAAMR